MGGKSVKEFAQNLNNLHERVGSTFSELKPPVFKCTYVTDKSLRLHYYSHRDGLASMVIGLVKGLGKRFDEKIVIKQALSKGPSADHDEFEITYG